MKGILMNKYLVNFLLVVILTMPVWITGVSIRPWKPTIKVVLITLMVLLSTGFSIYVLLKPLANPSVFTVLASRIAIALYYVAVLISAFFAWRRR
jgi:hypothetical protein